MPCVLLASHSRFHPANGLNLGKSWACKHWKFQNNYFVIFLHFCCIFLHLGLSFWICVVIFLSFFVISLSFLCHFFVICLSFYCHFGNGKMEKKHCLKMTTMTDLLLSRGSTKYKEQVEKLLESQPAVKKDRAGELALGNSFLGLPGRGVVSRLGVQGRLKNRVGGRGRGEMARGGGSGPRSGADLETPKTQLYQHASHFFAFCLHFLCIFFAFFVAFPRLGVIFWACFLHFPNRESFFCIFFCVS